MKINIKKIKFFALFTMISLMFSACDNDPKKNENTTETSNTSSKVDENHQDENTNIATLTAEQMQTIGLQLGKIEQKQLIATLKANGVLSIPNNNKADVTSLYEGAIKNLNVQIGDQVKKNQIIASITNPQFIQLQEEYLTTESKIVFADQELKRQKALNEGNAGIGKNLENAASGLNILRTRKASLQKQIILMGINPNLISNSNLQSTLVIKSPISGTVSNIYAKIGSYIDASSPVIEIVNNDALHLDLQVFEKDLPQIKIGQTIYFTVTNNPKTQYDATVFSISSSFENESKTIAVHCKVNGNKKGLIEGMNITGILSLNEVLIPAVLDDAIVNAEGKYYIFVQTDNRAEFHTKEGIEEHTNKKSDEKETNNFEKIEVMKGISNMGYTAIIPVKDIPSNAKIVTKGAFFINAKLSNIEEDHDH